MDYSELTKILQKDDFEGFLLKIANVQNEISSLALLAYHHSAERCLCALFFFYSFPELETEISGAIDWNIIKIKGRYHLATSIFVEKLQKMVPLWLDSNSSPTSIFIRHYIANVNLYEKALHDFEIQTQICLDLLEKTVESIAED